MCLLQHITPFSQKKVTYCSCYETFYLLTQTDTIFQIYVRVGNRNSRTYICVVTFYFSSSQQIYFLEEQISICLPASGNISWPSKLIGGGYCLTTITSNKERCFLISVALWEPGKKANKRLYIYRTSINDAEIYKVLNMCKGSRKKTDILRSGWRGQPPRPWL